MRMLERWKDFEVREVVHLLCLEEISPKTYNTRLRILKGFYQWLVRSKCVDFNPLEDVQPKKLKKEIKDNRKPFSVEEIGRILNALKNDTFYPSCSKYKHSHYYPFVYFIFILGVRPAEAVGLRVKYVNLENRIVEIRETMARTMKGSHANARVRKATKNGKARVLPIDVDLLQALKPLINNKASDDLVFTSPNGKLIDDRMFQRRVFKRILQALDIQFRVLYACRHTFGSRCIQEGMTLVMTAFLMGNNPETALRNYVHQLDLPKSLPKLL